MVGQSVITPPGLIAYWKDYPKSMPLSSVLRLIEGYAVPAEELRELQDIDARIRGVKSEGAEPLREPIIPSAYRASAGRGRKVVEDQSADKGIFDDGGASGVLIEGADDISRGAVAADLLLAAQKRCMSNAVCFVDWGETVGRCRSAPLYGDGSKAAILGSIQDSRVAVLHSIDRGIAEKDAWSSLADLLRIRNSNRRTTILTSSVNWLDLKGAAFGKGDLVECLTTCIAFPGGGLNVIGL